MTWGWTRRRKARRKEGMQASRANEQHRSAIYTHTAVMISSDRWRMGDWEPSDHIAGIYACMYLSIRWVGGGIHKTRPYGADLYEGQSGSWLASRCGLRSEKILLCILNIFPTASSAAAAAASASSFFKFFCCTYIAI
jgi:hypothetical protein